MDDIDDKEVVFNVKTPLSLRERFKKVANANDSDASKEVRKFMKKYISEKSNLTMDLTK